MDIDVDPFDDLTDGAANNAKGSSKFQPKAKFRPARKPFAAASISTSQPQSTLVTVPSGTETGAAKPSNANNKLALEDNVGRNTSFEKSVGVTSDIFIGLEDQGDFRLDATNLETNIPPPESAGINDLSFRDPGTGETDVLNVGESIVSSCMGYGKTNDQEPEMEVLESVCLGESAYDPEHIAGQAGLDMDARIHGEACEATVSCSPNPFEFNEATKDSIPTLNQDDVLDLSSLGFTDLLAGEDVMGYDSLANDGGWNEKERLDPSQQQTISTDRRDKETVRPLQRKSQSTRLVDDIDGEVLPDMELSRECPSRTLEEGNSFDAEHQLENEETRDTIRNAGDEGPTSRKRKKSDEAAPSTSQKPKRFPHSTRRRRVNKALLEIPEDEIDYQSIPLRDIILLAEHKEKQLKKKRRKLKHPNGSGTSHAEGENHDAEDNPDLTDTTLYFNYQTYMNKPRTIRWSKKDTELFYEAVQQFGTDLSMIQQLFPELTRHQIKLKYKKEERQHPMRLQQALSSRSKDHSHYKNVIERLKQAAAEENRNAENEEEVDGQAEESSQAHDEEANEEENGENGCGVQSEGLSKEEEQEEEAAEEEEEDDDDDVEYFQYTSV